MTHIVHGSIPPVNRLSSLFWHACGTTATASSSCRAAENRFDLERTAPGDRTALRRPTRAENEKTRRHRPRRRGGHRMGRGRHPARRQHRPRTAALPNLDNWASPIHPVRSHPKPRHRGHGSRSSQLSSHHLAPAHPADAARPDDTTVRDRNEDISLSVRCDDLSLI